MRLQLQSIHFGGGNSLMSGNGQLILRCTAQIGNYYQENTEKELGIPQKDPIPARGEQIVTIPIFFKSIFFYFLKVVTSSIGVEASRNSLFFNILAVILITLINKISR
jgi:hypothetical protein